MATIKAYASNIISPYHRTGILAFLEFFSSANRPVEASIHTDAGNWNNSLLESGTLHGAHYHAVLENMTIRFGPADLMRAIFTLLFRRDAGNPDCLVIGHSRVNLKLLAGLIATGRLTGKTRIATVVIDEGIGSYAGYRYRYRAFCRENSPGITGRLLYRCIYPLNQYLLRWRRLVDYDWCLLVRQGAGHYSPNTRAIGYYRQAFRQAGADMSGPDTRPDILLVTQPLAGLGLVRPDEYQAAVARLKQICDDSGLSVLVKAHPAEDLQQYRELGLQPAAGTATVETLIISLRPVMVLGFSSTALINSRLIFDIRSASMLDLLPSGKLLREQLFEDRNIRDLYLQNVDFIEDWAQLQARLALLKTPGGRVGQAT